MTTTTHYAVIQLGTLTVYGVGEDPSRACDDAAEHGMACTCADDDADCIHVYGERPEGFTVVPCTAAAAAHVCEHGGQPSPLVTVSRAGVCLRSDGEN